MRLAESENIELKKSTSEFDHIDPNVYPTVEQVMVDEKPCIRVRVDVPEIDPEAFREAIINAFCHRDYREYDSVNIAIFKDRLEIRSPGLLYGGLTVSDIRNKMISVRRNELLADLFQRSHRIEKWGRGIKMILEREPRTDFEEVGTALFVARFWRQRLG